MTEKRFYFVPKIGRGTTQPRDPFRPKYVDRDALGPGWHFDSWTGKDYGHEPVCILAVDITPEQHALLVAQPDVLAVPSPLDTPISEAAAPVLRNTLERMNIPGAWLTAGLSYRDLMGGVVKAFAFMQRYHGINPASPLFEAGIALDTPWNELSEAQTNRLIAAADNLNLDRTAITSPKRIGQIIRDLSVQLPRASMDGVVF
jgi:hypothetical protein